MSTKIEVEWIECGERLPLEGDGETVVIVETRFGDVFPAKFKRYKREWRFKDIDSGAIDAYATNEESGYIVRWMRLPPAVGGES